MANYTSFVHRNYHYYLWRDKQKTHERMLWIFFSNVKTFCTIIVCHGLLSVAKYKIAVTKKLPNFKTPIMSSTQPARNARIIANSGGLSSVYCSVSNDIRLVGPIDTSFMVPKNT